MNEVLKTGESIDEEVFVARTEKNSAYTTSLDVAEKFGKKHHHVLESIKKLIKKNPETEEMFWKTFYKSRGKDYPMYKMTRAGFSMIALSYTGDEATKWKIKYINAFNKMEQIIREEYIILREKVQDMPQRGSKEFFAMALIDANNIIQEQAKQIEEMKPAVTFQNAITASSDCILVRELAKFIQQALCNEGIEKKRASECGANHLYDWMRRNNYVCKTGSDKNLPTQKSQDLGLFMINEASVSINGNTSAIRKYAKVTTKGQKYFIDAILKIYKNGGSILEK